MGQFDDFKSIAMLFTGAFLVSFGVIAFLNIEIQSRSNHGAKMRNENLFEVLGRKISAMIASLREKNSHRRSLLYHVFVGDNGTRSSMRKLQYSRKDSTGSGRRPEWDLNENHRLRHGRNIKRLTQLLLREKNDSEWGKGAFGEENKLRDNGFVGVSNRTSATNNDTGKNLPQGLQLHDRCYTTNDVLQIIAITCLVNFIFWFLIIFAVNTLTRNQKMWKFNSLESLTSIDSGSEFELNQPEVKAEDFRSPKSRHFLRNYVNSLGNETEGLPPEREFYSLEGNTFQEKIRADKWVHQRFIQLSNMFFDSVAFDNHHENPLKLWDKKSRNGQIKRNVSDDVKGLVLEMNSKMPMSCYINCPLNIKQTLGIQYPFFHMVVKLPVSTFFAFDVQVLDDKSIRRRLRVSTVQTFVDIHPFMCKLPLTLENGWNRVTLPLHHFLKDIYGTAYLQTLRVAVYSNCILKKIYFSDKEYLEEDIPTEFHIEDPDLSENYRLRYTAMVTQKRKNSLSYYPDLINANNKRTSSLLRNKIL